MEDNKNKLTGEVCPTCGKPKKEGHGCKGNEGKGRNGQGKGNGGLGKGQGRQGKGHKDHSHD